jgi:hypothetical protein
MQQRQWFFLHIFHCAEVEFLRHMHCQNWLHCTIQLSRIALYSPCQIVGTSPYQLLRTNGLRWGLSVSAKYTSLFQNTQDPSLGRSARTFSTSLLMSLKVSTLRWSKSDVFLSTPVIRRIRRPKHHLANSIPSATRDTCPSLPIQHSFKLCLPVWLRSYPILQKPPSFLLYPFLLLFSPFFVYFLHLILVDTIICLILCQPFCLFFSG